MEINELYLISCVAVLFFFSLIIKICLSFLKIDFLHSGQNALTLFILPQVAYIVTTAVSGNLALSLGLVGALSIVRFRNPVRSSMELAIYFMTIGAGIAATVNIKLTIVIGAVFIGLTAFSLIAKKFIPDGSYLKTQLATEPQIGHRHIIQIESLKSIENEIVDEVILSKTINKNDNNIKYHFIIGAYSNQKAIEFTEKISKIDGVQNIRYDSTRTDDVEIS